MLDSDVPLTMKAHEKLAYVTAIVLHALYNRVIVQVCYTALFGCCGCWKQTVL